MESPHSQRFFVSYPICGGHPPRWPETPSLEKDITVPTQHWSDWPVCRYGSSFSVPFCGFASKLNILAKKSARVRHPQIKRKKPTWDYRRMLRHKQQVFLQVDGRACHSSLRKSLG